MATPVRGSPPPGAGTGGGEPVAVTDGAAVGDGAAVAVGEVVGDGAAVAVGEVVGPAEPEGAGVGAIETDIRSDPPGFGGAASDGAEDAIAASGVPTALDGCSVAA
ncbi:hypothetical protein QQG74_01675 [Micromonospora sp. FIMYZ51]|uniref:hypothetical protein n=1 Tax=Micromonospora sp. FIMYZ51 TaxID=3051832 RepID=UPI00311FD50F